MILRSTLLVALVGAAVSLAEPAVSAPAPPGAGAVTRALQANMDASLEAFNKGDFEGYLHDVFPRLSYNGLMIERARLVAINKELAETFPNLRMRYKTMRIHPLGETEASATSVATFDGQTDNYDGSGLPATYHEEGQLTALYRKVGEGWRTHELQVAWDDAFIDIGQPFATMGFTSLPTLVGTEQPYKLRLHVGQDARPHVTIFYAYTLAPLKDVLDKEGAERVFRTLHFQPVPAAGVVGERAAPPKEGTFAHVLVINKVYQQGEQEVVLGQKVYTRLMRVE